MSRREFDIAFVGLKMGAHEFEYQIDDKFFEEDKDKPFYNCATTVKLTLEKNQGFFMLKFEIGGNVTTSCDRCGNDLVVNLWDEFDLVVKVVENPETCNDNEDDPNVFYIGRNETHLHVKDFIHDFVWLSFPNQNECGTDEQGNSKCNQEVLKKLQNIKVDGSTSNNDLWKGLDKIKFDN